MINRIPTNERAHRMKALGFAQPDLEPGQYWYLGPYLYYVWGQARSSDWSLSEDWNLLPVGSVGPSPTFTQDEVKSKEAFSYAPSAEEILCKLPKHSLLGTECNTFSCHETLTPYNSNICESAADACADAWIDDQI